MKASARTLAGLSWLGTVSLSLGCGPVSDQPSPSPLPPASAAAAPTKQPTGKYILVQLGDLSTVDLEHEVRCRGSAVGSTTLRCRLEDSILLNNYLDQVKDLTQLVHDDLESEHALEVHLDSVKGAFVTVEVLGMGHADATSFLHPTPALTLEYNALTQLLDVKREEGITGNRMLGLTRGLILAKYIVPHLQKAVEPVKDIVQQVLGINAFVEPTNIGSEWRGAEVRVLVKFRLPNNVIALQMCKKVLAAPTVKAVTCDVRAL